MARAGDNVLLVRWNQHEAELLRRFAAYLTDDAFVDVTLWCPDRCFKAHRVLLSACSDYLERVLLEQAGGAGWEPVSVVLPGVPADDVSRLLQLVYRGQALVPAAQLPRLLESARALGLRLLQSAALRVCAAQPHHRDHHQEQCFQGEPQVPNRQMLENDNDRSPPVVSASIGPLITQNRPSIIEDRCSVSSEHSLPPEITEQEMRSPEWHPAGAQTLTVLPPYGFTPHSDAADSQAQRERVGAAWGGPLQLGAAAGPAPHWGNPRPAAAHGPQAAGAGHSTAGAPAPTSQRQEQSFDGKQQADNNQISENSCIRVPTAVSAFMKPVFPRKPPATVEHKFTVPKEQTSPMENTGKEIHSPKYHLASAQILPPQGLALQSALRADAAAAQAQMTSAWGAAAVGPPPQLHAVQQVPPAVATCPRLEAQPQAAAAPAADPRAAGSAGAGAPTCEWQAPPLPIT